MHTRRAVEIVNEALKAKAKTTGPEAKAMKIWHQSISRTIIITGNFTQNRPETAM